MICSASSRFHVAHDANDHFLPKCSMSGVLHRYWRDCNFERSRPIFLFIAEPGARSYTVQYACTVRTTGLSARTITPPGHSPPGQEPHGQFPPPYWLRCYCPVIATLDSQRPMLCWCAVNKLITHGTASNFRRVLASLTLAAHRRNECIRPAQTLNK